MDGTRDLRLLLASRHPLIVARMDDETRFMAFARRAAELCGYPIWTWSVTLGLARDGNASQVDTQEPKKALAFVRQLQAPGVYVFHDLRPHLGDPVVVRHLKEFTFAERTGQTILITGPEDACGDRRGPPRLGSGACDTGVRSRHRATRGGGTASRLRLSGQGIDGLG